MTNSKGQKTNKFQLSKINFQGPKKLRTFSLCAFVSRGCLWQNTCRFISAFKIPFI